MHNHQSKYTFGDIVYLTTDVQQMARVVIGITLGQGYLKHPCIVNG